jgi:uncharacterized protein
LKEGRLSLQLLKVKLTVCQLDKDASIPTWAVNDSFFSVSKTEDELSIVCSENKVPSGIKSEKDWRAFKVIGPLDFSMTGILAPIANVLADSKISIFAISTFDTDYILVKNKYLERAVKVLDTFCNVYR